MVAPAHVNGPCRRWSLAGTIYRRSMLPDYITTVIFSDARVTPV